MIRKFIHIVPREGMRAVKVPAAQAELVVHRRNGTIGEKNSHFKPDPMPPRG